jgi:hypothetical protein
MMVAHDPGLKLQELMDLAAETEWVNFRRLKRLCTNLL